MTVLPLIPRPAQFEIRAGQYVLTDATRIQASPEFLRETAHLIGPLRRATGFPLNLIGPEIATNDSNCIKLLLDAGLSHLGAEGYRLTIGSQVVELRAAANAGLFYGIQTLLQLFPSAVLGDGPRQGITWSLPQLVMEDHPRFSWRGAMLDCGRHFYPVELVRKFIDLLALHKLNIFHWHLTEDQGWRIEIKKYPKLTEVGAWRRRPSAGAGNSSGDDALYGGFYTQEQIREIVRYAADRHITIVPEIEMPGHAQAAVAAYPELGCTGEKVEVGNRWGVSENIFNPREETILFLQNVLLEVMELFPSPFIHIGGDEAAKKQWDQSPEIQAFMPTVGVKDSHELQSYFIRRMDRFLTEHGRRLIGWDEILEGGLAEGASVMSWQGIEGGITAANQGHDVVMAPQTHTYFDFYQSESMADEPRVGGGFLPLEKVYGYEPVPAEIAPEKARHIMGVQGQLWTEYIPTWDLLEYMAFPRLTALAEVAWSRPEHRDFGNFMIRLSGFLKRLVMLGVRYRPLQ